LKGYTNKKNTKVNILVFGDLMLDTYLWGNCSRISPEAPVQIIDVKKETNLIGGAGNVANNLISLGASVDLLSVVGDCEVARSLIDLIKKSGIGHNKIIKSSKRQTSKKTRVISSQQQVLRFDSESSENIDKVFEDKLFNMLLRSIDDYDIVVISDYAKGVCTKSLTQRVINICNERNLKVLIDPKGTDYSKYKNAYLLTPNARELSEATNIALNDESKIEEALKEIKKQCNLDIAMVTLSEKGIGVIDNGFKIFPTHSREVFDVTGAGDTVISAIAYALALDYKINAAIKFANLAASIVVGKIGASTASFNEILEYETAFHLTSSFSNVKTNVEIVKIVADLKLRDKKIVFTNGCFDILHSGHLSYLEKAKEFGDILIVGVNSDQSVKKLKGKKRPIINEKERAFLIAGLEVVDYVVIFNEETPLRLIESIKPNTLVKGSDYQNQTIVGSEIVQEVQLVDFVTGKSSSNIIRKILEDV